MSCDVFYCIKFDKTDQIKYRLNTYYEHHTMHSFKIKKLELTPSMIEDIKTLENKYKVDLSYNSVYKEYRKMFPILGPYDVRNFISWCEQNDYNVAKYVNENEKHYTKLLITSTYMRRCMTFLETLY